MTSAPHFPNAESAAMRDRFEAAGLGLIGLERHPDTGQYTNTSHEMCFIAFWRGYQLGAEQEPSSE